MSQASLANVEKSTIALWGIAVSNERGIESERAQAVELLRARVSQLHGAALAGIVITPSDVITLHAKIDHPTLWELTKFEELVRGYRQEALLKTTIKILSSTPTIQ